MTTSQLTKKILSFILTYFLLLTFPVSTVSAQIFNEDRLDLVMDSNDQGTLIVELSPQLSEPGSSILAEITHPEFLVFKELHEGDIGCEPELMDAESSYLSFFCAAPESTEGFVKGVAVRIEFDIIEYGEGKILVDYAEVDNFEVAGGSLSLVTSVNSETRSSEGFDLRSREGFIWLLLVAGASVFIVIMIAFSYRRKNSADDQLVFASLVGMLVLGAFSAILVGSPRISGDISQFQDVEGVSNFEMRDQSVISDVNELNESPLEGRSSDLNQDGVTDMLDHSILLDSYINSEYGLEWNITTDISGDGKLTLADILLIEKIINKHAND